MLTDDELRKAFTDDSESGLELFAQRIEVLATSKAVEKCIHEAATLNMLANKETDLDKQEILSECSKTLVLIAAKIRNIEGSTSLNVSRERQRMYQLIYDMNKARNV